MAKRARMGKGVRVRSCEEARTLVQIYDSEARRISFDKDVHSWVQQMRLRGELEDHFFRGYAPAYGLTIVARTVLKNMRESNHAGIQQ